ncbi:hypothetical protein F4861DRAFT_338309 [Xylaria intraflava]|nr:hypothetical protein F4861DRAFT_338309 [Xylaria intraflava]
MMCEELWNLFSCGHIVHVGYVPCDHWSETSRSLDGSEHCPNYDADAPHTTRDSDGRCDNCAHLPSPPDSETEVGADAADSVSAESVPAESVAAESISTDSVSAESVSTDSVSEDDSEASILPIEILPLVDGSHSSGPTARPLSSHSSYPPPTLIAFASVVVEDGVTLECPST